MNRLIAWWSRNPVAANLLMVGMFLSGLMGYLQMEREVFPTVKVNSVEVNIAWPGASPKDIEQQIITRVETVLRQLDHVEKIHSTALHGIALIELKASTKADMPQLVNQVKLQVDGINSFPRDIEPPIISEVVLRENVIRLALFGETSEIELKRLAEQLQEQLIQLPAVHIVELNGARREEVTIELSESAMRQYRLTFDEVTRAIQQNSLNMSAGQIRTQQGVIQLRSQQLALTQLDFEKIIVRQNNTGGTLRLSDIARVIDGFEDSDRTITYNGKQAVLIDIMSTEKMDVVDVSLSVENWLDESVQQLPEGINLEVWQDSADMYNNRMGALSSSAFSGLVLVFVVLFLSLRPKIALWVCIGIATTYAGTFALLPANDVSINILSTFAFLLVLGIVVDDAIVVGESIHEQTNSDGEGDAQSAAIGTQLVAKPILYAVLTTMMAFLPWFFISGEDAQVTRQISIVIICALSFSLVEAFFILPAHLGRLKPRKNDGKLLKFQQRVENSIVNFSNTVYRRIVTWVTENAFLTMTLFVVCFVVSINLLSSGWVKFSFLPEIENSQVTFSVGFDDSTAQRRTIEVYKQIRAAHQALSLPTKINSELATLARDRVSVTLDLSAEQGDDVDAKQVAAAWRSAVGDIPDAQSINVSFKSNQAPGIEFQVNHADLNQLQLAVAELKLRLSEYQDVFDIRDDLQTGNEELHIKMLPTATKLGLTLAEVVTQVRQAYYGQEVQRLPRNGNDVRVMVRYPEDTRRSINSLQDMFIRTDDGREIPLLAVAELSVQSGLQRIERHEGQRSATISAELRDNQRSAIQSELQSSFVPQWQMRFPGVSLGEVGEAESEKTLLLELLSYYLIALFLMYTLIAVAFKSYWQPLIVMVAIPFGFMGAVYGHFLFNIPMALFSYFGIGAAAGVVVNDNLVLMDYVNRLKDKGVDYRNAMIEATVKRFRPIILTSLTTFTGLLPMLMDQSKQAQFLQPTVVSLAFGVLLAAIVTLLLVPAVFVFFFSFGDSHSSVKRSLFSRMFTSSN